MEYIESKKGDFVLKFTEESTVKYLDRALKNFKTGKNKKHKQ